LGDGFGEGAQSIVVLNGVAANKLTVLRAGMIEERGYSSVVTVLYAQRADVLMSMQGWW
jgi:hypothetical protein